MTDNLGDSAEKKVGKIISQKKVAAYCLLMNCHLINVKKDLKNNFRAIFIFKDDEKLKVALETYNQNKDVLNGILHSFDDKKVDTAQD